MVDANKSTQIFDPHARTRSKSRAAPNFQDFDFLQRHAQAQIEDRLSEIKRHFTTTKTLSHEDFTKDFEALDLAPHSLDCIRSTLALHTVNDLPGVLHQIKRGLVSDGLFIAAIFGGETLYQLRESLMQTELELKGGASPRIYPFADKQQVGGLLQRAGFALPVVDSELVTVTYKNMFKLMHDLRGMGENNIIKARSRINPGKAFFVEAAKYYQEHFAEHDGRIPATFEIIYMIGWSPHDSQQKPLKPGSAQNRLADALNTTEVKTGDIDD